MAGYTIGQMNRFYHSGKKVTSRKALSGVRDALVRKGENVVYYVWGNRIATYNVMGRTLTVSSAGWETDLTKNRLNQVLPSGYYITQKKFIWYMKYPNGAMKPFRSGIRVRV